MMLSPPIDHRTDTRHPYWLSSGSAHARVWLHRGYAGKPCSAAWSILTSRDTLTVIELRMARLPSRHLQGAGIGLERRKPGGPFTSHADVRN